MVSKSHKLAVCFFGITRSVSYTMPSIEKNVLAPARKSADLRVYAHFFQLAQIDNPRSGEHGALDQDSHKLIPSDWLQLEAPGACLKTAGFDALCAHGDAWNDDFTSLRNLVHQLHSLKTVTNQALADGYETVAFIRPDLRYHDSLRYALWQARRHKGPDVWLPSWQAWGGRNDRFAICKGRAAIEAYGTRLDRALDYCTTTERPLQSEQLLAWCLDRAAITVHDIDVCASRVRMDGSTSVQDHFASDLHRFASRWSRRLGVKAPLQAVMDATGVYQNPTRTTRTNY